MRTRHILAALIALSAGCSDATAPRLTSPTEVVLAIGREVRVDSLLQLTFLKVTADSRCPAQAECFWAGDAAVAIACRVGTGPSYADTLHTTLDARNVAFADWSITLVGLTPYPDTPTPIPAGRYVARLRIERLPLPD